MRLWLAVAVFLALGCRADPADDRLARTFLERVRTRDPSGAELLDPSGRVTWSSLSEMALYFPPGAPDAVNLVEREWATDKYGDFRKLTYRVERGRNVVLMEVWIVDVEGHRLVNSFQIRPPE